MKTQTKRRLFMFAKDAILGLIKLYIATRNERENAERKR